MEYGILLGCYRAKRGTRGDVPLVLNGVWHSVGVLPGKTGYTGGYATCIEWSMAFCWGATGQNGVHGVCATWIEWSMTLL